MVIRLGCYFAMIRLPEYITFLSLNGPQWQRQPDNLVLLLVFIDCENNEFLKKWIMMINQNWHSRTKWSGWLPHYNGVFHFTMGKPGGSRNVKRNINAQHIMCVIKP